MDEKLKEALELVLEHLTEINAHTIAGLLDWTMKGCPADTQQDERYYRAWLNAKSSIYYLDEKTKI